MSRRFKEVNPVPSLSTTRDYEYCTKFALSSSKSEAQITDSSSQLLVDCSRCIFHTIPVDATLQDYKLHVINHFTPHIDRRIIFAFCDLVDHLAILSQCHHLLCAYMGDK